MEQHSPSSGAQRSESAPSNRMGQANEHKSKSETTGQAPSNQPSQSTQSGSKQDKLNSKSEKNEKNATEKSEQRGRSTTGQASEKSEHRGDKSEQRGRSTTGQAPENRNNMENKAGQNNNMEKGRSGQSGTMENRSTTQGGTHEGTVQGRSSSSSSVNLTSEQKTKIHSVIIADRSAPRVAHVDFDVRVGTVVPRGKVKLAPLPSSIVEIEPAWRGFEYFLVGDEIVVVDPNTFDIVAVIPA
jgi:hypothetical protein